MKDNVTPIADAARKVIGTPEQQGDYTIEPAEMPADRGALAYGRAQVAALVIVQGQNVASIPPQVFAAVVSKDNAEEIIALVGPEKDLSSVRDAVLFSKAFELRAALRELVTVLDTISALDGEIDRYEFAARLANAKQVLADSDPQFLAVTPRKTAAQKLAEATANFDPSLTPDTSGILGETARTLEVGHDGPGGVVKGPSAPVAHHHV